MNLTVRRWIAAGFIITFIIVTPVLILFTAGYRYNFKKNQLQRTGALVIKSEPSSAKIFINGELQTSKTPARLNNILPEEQLITLEKNGYYPWSKKLNVAEQQTVFAEDIILFRKTTPELVHEQQISWLQFSPINDFALFIVQDNQQDYLYLLNLHNRKIRLLYNANQPLIQPKISWSHQDAYFLLQTKTLTKIFSTSLPKQEITVPLAKTTAPVYHWDQKNKDFLYLVDHDGIYQLNLPLNKTSKILSLTTATLQDFFIAAENIFTVQKIKEKYFLTRWPRPPNENTLSRALELDQAIYQILDSVEDNLILRDLTNNLFYLINYDLDKINLRQFGVSNFDYLAKTKKLLVQSDQEINLLDLNKQELIEENITRYSRGIQLVRWHPEANYIFTLQNGKIDIIELDDRHGHFILSLPLTNITNFNLDANGKYLFFEQDKYLWQMLIK